mgnify:CR=1 FL=1
MKICLITYDRPHLKTAQVFWGLWFRREFEISFLIVPFKDRKQRTPSISHRPPQFIGVSGQTIAETYNLTIYNYEERRLALRNDAVLVCGANILEDEFVKAGKVINCHPGLIPKTRGLDSFKWAIHDGQQVGNSLHWIDSEPDAGEVIHELPTPVFRDDTLTSFAMRHYENEIFLLQHFDNFLNGKGNAFPLEKGELHKRMPPEKEEMLLHDFDAYKERWCSEV